MEIIALGVEGPMRRISVQTCCCWVIHIPDAKSLSIWMIDLGSVVEFKLEMKWWLEEDKGTVTSWLIS